MPQFTLIRVEKSTSKKVDKLQKKLEKSLVGKITKGTTVDIAVSEKLMEMGPKIPMDDGEMFTKDNQQNSETLEVKDDN